MVLVPGSGTIPMALRKSLPKMTSGEESCVDTKKGNWVINLEGLNSGKTMSCILTSCSYWHAWCKPITDLGSTLVDIMPAGKHHWCIKEMSDHVSRRADKSFLQDFYWIDVELMNMIGCKGKVFWFWLDESTTVCKLVDKLLCDALDVDNSCLWSWSTISSSMTIAWPDVIGIAKFRSKLGIIFIVAILGLQVAFPRAVLLNSTDG